MQKTEASLKLNTWLLPILVGLLLLLEVISPYRGWIILLVGLGGAWLISYLWARSLLRGLVLTREVRYGWAQVGDHVEEQFVLVNQGRFPALWAEVVDHSTVPGYQASRGTGIGSGGSIQWRKEAVCTRRGLFTLGPTSLLAGDPFGIYTVHLHYPASMPFVVMPPVVPIPTVEVVSGGRAGEGRPRANAPERTVSAASVREYTYGDSPRWIHWRTSARHDALFVRLFDGTPAGDWWIVLDMDQQVHVGEGEDATEEHAVILAASLADRGLRLRRGVGLVAHGEELVWLPPQGGDNRLWEILRELALISPGQRPLAELLAHVGPAMGQRGGLVLITPNVSGDWIESLVPLLRRGVTPTVLLLDPVSFGGSGDVRGVETLFSTLGVAHHVVTRDLLDRPEARPGQEGKWEWRVSATGRAVPIHRPLDTAWRALS